METVSVFPHFTMSAASLLKVPLLLSAAYFSYCSGKSPQPPPKDSEAAKFDNVEKQASRTIFRFGPPTLRTIMIATCIAESAIIVAQNYRSHPLSRRVLDVLLQGASGSSIRTSRASVIGWALLAGGTLLRLVCYRHLGRFFTFELALHDNHKLVTSGPYSIVRHPSYSGIIAAVAGVVLIQLGAGSWWEALGLWRGFWGVACGLAWVAIWSVIPGSAAMRTRLEDIVLRREFGQEWEDWAKRTPYRLFPGIY
ncbi:putative protein-S-isoprenylcysteine O-methyltransferase [Grifola frondosa]|uniref:Protein-S-isoprenylcysteine O-methyltransferase n=1 Tax=Grifola frondosa TaxID=5627 RepID=A0A1C7M5Q4_GRIFR|nr:putative protein-S-isoprenylcysteine O-methyltransferase [Grifola frondosa]